MSRTLTTDEARKFYDRFGSRQDKQAFYEDVALDELIRHADFEHAKSVFEFGCGTGRLAQRLLENHLPAEARYVGIDLSTTMIDLSHDRLAPFSERVEILQADGSTTLPVEDDSCDRFVSTYVLDLLSEADIHAVIAEAARILKPGGRLCLCGLTHGPTTISRLVSVIWRGIHLLSPRIVGGCRPTRVAEFLTDDLWQIEHQHASAVWGIPSEVVVASRC